MKISIRDITLVSMFASLTAIGAFISVPVGPVPVTLQSIFVLLSGILIGPRLGALSQIVYIVLGLIGIPIFAGFTGGPQSLLKPSFGFLIGFIFSAYITGKIAHSHKRTSAKRIWLATLTGTITMYIFGLPYMYYILNIVLEKGLSFMTIMNMGCIIFLPGDIMKLILASIVGTRGQGICPTTGRH